MHSIQDSSMYKTAPRVGVTFSASSREEDIFTVNQVGVDFLAI